MSTTVKPDRVTTTALEEAQAREAFAQLADPTAVLTIEHAGRQTAELPAEIGRILQHVLDVMARGGTITIGAMPEILTTSAAADILGVSRPTVIKMINEGSLPAHMVGTHRRLRSEDVTSALRARRARERAAFDSLREIDDRPE